MDPKKSIVDKTKTLKWFGTDHQACIENKLVNFKIDRIYFMWKKEKLKRPEI